MLAPALVVDPEAAWRFAAEYRLLGRFDHPGLPRARGEGRTEGGAGGDRDEGSPICCPDGTPPPPEDSEVYVATTRPGHRVPLAWLKEGA